MSLRHSAKGSFKSFIHKTYIDKQTVKDLIDSFMKVKPRYNELIIGDPIVFFNFAQKTISRKIKIQDEVYSQSDGIKSVSHPHG